MIWQVLAVGGGGALGAMLRFAVTGWVSHHMLETAPGLVRFSLGTFVSNWSGCLLLGFLAAVLDAQYPSPVLRAFLLIGVLGSYTTFSTFGYETFRFFEEGRTMLALVYGLGSPVTGVLGVWLGLALASRS